jgi:3-oxoadipate enol-lactonase
MTSDLQEATARMRDGCGLSYQVMGAAGPRIVLVHSLAMGKSFWRAVADELVSAMSVLTYDCRGHGASDKPPGPYSISQFADDLADLLDAVGWPSAVVAGASMGGAISLAFAARYPTRTNGLGLVDTTAWYGAEAPKQWAERADRALKEGLKDLVAFQKTRWFTDAFRERHPAIVEDSIAVFLRNAPETYAETCRMLGGFDLRGELPGIKTPTAVVVGREDYAAPVAMAEELHRGIAGSSLTIIEDGRHLTPLEQPQRIAQELRNLLERAAP